MCYFKILTTTWREKAENWSLKREALERRESCRNSFLSVATGHVSLPVAAKIICTPMCSVFVLLCFSHRTAYWSLSTNKMSNLVRLVSANMASFASVTMYVNFLILIKPTQATLNVVSILRSATKRASSSVIFPRMFFVIRRWFCYLLGNSLLSPLMMRAIHESSKPARLKRLSIWYDLKVKR